jgi:hypothetical protein
MATHPVTEYVAGQMIASYGTYPEAQRAVDFLSDQRFPVENTAIVGVNLRLVEIVTGRLDHARAALAGAASGAWVGLLVGLFLAIFTTSTVSFLAMVLWGLVWGAVAGAVFALIAYTLTRGRRDFSSTRQLVADRYEVTVVGGQADSARELLTRLT